jgi:hypothetical protein
VVRIDDKRARHLRRITKAPEADAFALTDAIANVLDGQSGILAIQALALSLFRVIGQSPDPERPPKIKKPAEAGQLRAPEPERSPHPSRTHLESPSSGYRRA